MSGFLRTNGKVTDMRALLLARKSNKVKRGTDATGRAVMGEGLSLETQDEVTGAFADSHGWTVVDAAGDTVSGRKVKPRERKGLGKWLTDQALSAQWDVLIAAAGDRISREHIEHWSDLEAWVVANGKTLVVCERGGVFFPPRHEGDSYNWTGIKTGAGNEWDIIRGRNIRTQCAIMRSGSWAGRAPYGYRIVGDKYAKRLEVIEELRPIIVAVFDMAIAGDSLRTIGAWFMSAGIKTERGHATWNEGQVRQIIANDTYSGTATRGCAECGESHDLPAPAIVDMATQKRAQAALRSRRTGNGGGRPSVSPAMLVPMCPDCGIKMYRIQPRTGTPYYKCKERTSGGKRVGCRVMVKCHITDAAVDSILSAETEDEMMATIAYPAAALESEIEDIRRKERKAFESDDVDAMMTLRAKRKALEVELEGAERERVESVPTGRTYGDAWKALDPSERRAWLKLRGLTVQLSKDAVEISSPAKVGKLSAIGRMMPLG
jgi:site-specific DNA recombinase